MSIVNLKFKNALEFDKGFSKLQKKFFHLDEDIETLKKALFVQHYNSDSFGHEVSVRISKLGNKVKVPIFKVKKFYSQDMKGKGSKSGFRIMYAFEEEKDLITFLEIYHKSKQSNHTNAIIYKYF